jgi:hypothetical protein
VFLSLREIHTSKPFILQVTSGATFNGMMRYTFDIVGGGVDAVEAHCISWPNKCVRLGWGVFILILLSSYTANLAAFLTATAGKNTTMKHIHEVIEKDIAICTHEVVMGQVNRSASLKTLPGLTQARHLSPHEARSNQSSQGGSVVRPVSNKRASVPVVPSRGCCWARFPLPRALKAASQCSLC